jgi:hypothetical protein
MKGCQKIVVSKLIVTFAIEKSGDLDKQKLMLPANSKLIP